MSELRTYDVIMTPTADGPWILKSEADKVIAEKDKEIVQLQAMLEERNKLIGELKYELAVATGDCQALAGKFGG